MPELSAVHIAIIATMTVVGVILGWLLRGNRSKNEKAAISAGRQEQINTQRVEHDGLAEQNKALMEQVSQYSASNIDAKNRAKESSLAVQEAYTRHDDLQREIKEIRGNLEVAMTERDQLQSNISSKADERAGVADKDAHINKLQIEIENWQNRLPPLIEKFRQRNEDADRLEADLNAARVHIDELETSSEPSQTRFEPVRDPDTLTDGRDASNQPMNDVPMDDESIDENCQSEDTLESHEEADIDDARDDDDFSEEPAITSIDTLQAIKGVGPAIEKTLNKLGIFRFQQISEMSEYDIDRVAKHLRGFRSRVYREDWIGQAWELGDQDSSG
jgi:predicted flap endonuclease-1-like 5' DNA nuclease